MKNLNVFLMVCMLLVASCNKETDVNLIQQHEGHEVIFLPRIEGHVMTRVSGNNWEDGDKIGIFAVNSGKGLKADSIFENNSNVLYEFSNNKFASSTPIRFPKKTDEKLDFIAYYPYKENLEDYKYPIDVSAQENLSTLDVLYSNNAKEKNKNSEKVDLHFNRKMSLIKIEVEAKEEIESLEGLSVKLKGLVAKGEMDLRDGTITSEATSSDIMVKNIDTVDGNKKVICKAILLPQTRDVLNIELKLNDYIFNIKPQINTLDSGKEYQYKVNIYPDRVESTLGGFTIGDWKVESNKEFDVEPGNGGEVNPEKPETPEPENPGGSGTQEPGGNTPQEPDFTLDKSEMSFESEGDLSEAVHVELPNDVEWSITANHDWITCAPAKGKGNGEATITVSENTATTDRTGTVTVTPTNSQHNPKTITITQKGKIASNPQELQLLFPGSDFEDKAVFEASLLKPTHNISYSSGFKKYGLQSLKIDVAKLIDILAFTAKVPAGFSAEGKNVIKFYTWRKTDRSISASVHLKDGKQKYFNLLDYNKDTTLFPSDEKKITICIDDQDNWLLVTLDISSIRDQINDKEGEALFSIYGSEGSEYLIFLDHITIE